MKSLRIAIIQHQPVHFHLEASTEKAIQLIREAARQGAQLIVFGETWLSGYPAWLDHCPEVAQWNNEAVKEVFARMHAHSPAADGEEIQRIREAAKEEAVIVCIGMNEKVIHGTGGGTLYNSFLLINENGEVINHHRKLMPTYTEKLVHGIGDAAGLKVSETTVGPIGGLICWEHWMPLSRQVLHNENELIHLALWPSVHEMHQVACRHYAFEGRCFVIAAGQMMQVKSIPAELKLPEYLKNNPDQYILNGGSCVIGPKGDYLLPPHWDQEIILYCTIENINTAIREKMTLDVSGHYSRPDIFNFSVERKRK